MMSVMLPGHQFRFQCIISPLIQEQTNYTRFTTTCNMGSSGGRVVKLLACGARGPGFRFPASPLEFSEIGYLMLKSSDMAEIPLKRHKSSIQPANQPICNTRFFKVPEEEQLWCSIGVWWSKTGWTHFCQHLLLCKIIYLVQFPV